MVIGTGYDGLVKVYNLATDSITSLNHHKANVCAIAESREGRFITGDDDGCVVMWSLQNENPIWSVTLGRDVRALTIVDDHVMVGVYSSHALLLDAKTGTKVQNLQEADEDVWGVAALYPGLCFAE
jgi:WD40 repeat protein